MRYKLVALIVLGLLLVAIPSGLVVGSMFTRDAQQEVGQLQSDFQQATADGVAEPLILPLQNRLANIAVSGVWEDPMKARQQLGELALLRRDFNAAYAGALAYERRAFASGVGSWTSLKSQADAAGLFSSDLAGPVDQLRIMAAQAQTPAGIHGVTGVLGSYLTALNDRLSAFNSAKSATAELLSQARASLQAAAKYRALKLSAFQLQLDGAERSLAAVNLPTGFESVQQQIRQTATAIRNLVSARNSAYAELAAAQAALASARTAGVSVTEYAARISALTTQLDSAGEMAGLNSLAAQLRSVAGELRAAEQALNLETTVTIAAPIYQQAMALDCETSALRVGLAYYGHYYSDAQLFADEPVDLRPPVMGANHAILQWGDPYVAFVGNVNGVAAVPTGYGVYYPVILNLARTHGLPGAIGGEGYSATTIYAELRAHHPVEVWVEYNWTTYQRGVWTAWDGRRVAYSYGEHAVTLTGVSATQVRVNDVGHGTQYWIDKTTFEASWSVLHDMAVIFK